MIVWLWPLGSAFGHCCEGYNVLEVLMFWLLVRAVMMSSVYPPGKLVLMPGNRRCRPGVQLYPKSNGSRCFGEREEGESL